MYGRITKVRKEIHQWDYSCGCLITTLEECEWIFSINGRIGPGVRCGTCETFEEAREKVEDAMREELAALKLVNQNEGTRGCKVYL